MKKEWIQFLKDPFDNSEIMVKEIARENNGLIEEGMLISASGNIYPVKQGIPCFLNESTQKIASVESFEYEWNEFGFLYAKKGWLLDIVNPLVGDESYFKGKTVVDCGAGSGAQTRWMAESGADMVISLELSNGIYTRHKETIKGLEDRIFAIQSDIANPPVKQFADIIYCVKVIQHTADVRQTFSKLVDLMHEKSVFLFNVYTEKSSAPLIRVARKITTLMPFKLVYVLSFILALPLFLVIKTIYTFLHNNELIPEIRSFKETWLDIYDLLGPHSYQDYMKKEDQLKMISDFNLNIIKETKFGYLLSKTKD